MELKSDNESEVSAYRLLLKETTDEGGGAAAAVESNSVTSGAGLGIENLSNGPPNG